MLLIYRDNQNGLSISGIFDLFTCSVIFRRMGKSFVYVHASYLYVNGIISYYCLYDVKGNMIVPEEIFEPIQVRDHHLYLGCERDIASNITDHLVYYLHFRWYI